MSQHMQCDCGAGPTCERYHDVKCPFRALMAAAPELLAALQAIVRITDGSQPKDYPGALMVARAAIAQATGQE